MLSFDQVTAITTDPLFLGAIIAVWLLPLILYIIVGSVAKAKSPSGQALSKPMIAYPNFWYGFFIFLFFQAGLFLILIIFPLWLKVFT